MGRRSGCWPGGRVGMGWVLGVRMVTGWDAPARRAAAARSGAMPMRAKRLRGARRGLLVMGSSGWPAALSRCGAWSGSVRDPRGAAAELYAGLGRTVLGWWCTCDAAFVINGVGVDTRNG